LNDLSAEQNLALWNIEYDYKSIFLTGKAGTGKSTVLKKFINNTDKNIVVLAPTGVAAINIGGQTIHSFFKFNNNSKRANIELEYGEKRVLQAIDTIVIDEISMVRSDLLDLVDCSLRVNRHEYGSTFGGVQMVFVGDLFQLPPVVTDKDVSRIKQDYQSEFFFDAICMDKYNYNHIELSNVFRQSEQQNKFKEILNDIRVGNNNADLHYLNSFCIGNPNNGICLTAYRATSNEMNAKKLNELNGNIIELTAQISGDFPISDYPCPEIIEIKIGANVVMLSNDKLGRWANGTIGIVRDYYYGELSIEIDNNIISVERKKYGKYETALDKHGKLYKYQVGEFSQFPIELAYAMTIHKSQGKTFDKIELDLGRGAFAHGQTYVALSRCKTINGISLKQPIKYSDLIIDKRVKKYHENIQNSSR